VFLRRRRVGEKLKKDKAFETIKGLHKSGTLKACKKASQVVHRWTSLWRNTWSFVGIPKEGRTVGILQGGFMTSRGPLDLTEVQGRYSGVLSRGSKLRRGRTIDPSHKDHRIYMWDHASRFHGLKSYERCNRNREIANHDILTAKKICVGPQWSRQVDMWHTISRFCSEKS
jgi:hypothetical protein